METEKQISKRQSGVRKIERSLKKCDDLEVMAQIHRRPIASRHAHSLRNEGKFFDLDPDKT